MEVIRIAIVEDQREIREGLRALIGGSPGFHVCGAYCSVEEAMPGLEREFAHVALVDIGLPGMSGIEGIRLMSERFPELHAMVLTIYDDDDRIFHAMCAGACGYLLKKTPPARLLECIQEVAAGGAPMSPEVARRVVEFFRTARPSEQAGCQLTPHELRLLKLLVEGHNYKTAAVKLGLSVNTVSFHVRKIYEKLQVHSKSQAVAKALKQRLV